MHRAGCGPACSAKRFIDMADNSHGHGRRRRPSPCTLVCPRVTAERLAQLLFECGTMIDVEIVWCGAVGCDMELGTPAPVHGISPCSQRQIPGAESIVRLRDAWAWRMARRLHTRSAFTARRAATASPLTQKGAKQTAVGAAQVAGSMNMRWRETCPGRSGAVRLSLLSVVNHCVHVACSRCWGMLLQCENVDAMWISGYVIYG